MCAAVATSDFPDPGRRCQHDIAARQQLEDRLLLVGVELQPLLPGPGQDPLVRRVAHRAPTTDPGWLASLVSVMASLCRGRGRIAPAERVAIATPTTLGAV
jgi:hypothetical protein